MNTETRMIRDAGRKLSEQLTRMAIEISETTRKTEDRYSNAELTRASIIRNKIKRKFLDMESYFPEDSNLR